jgi:biopolymer transport protein ExbD
VAILFGRNQASPTYNAACATPLPNWKTEEDGVGHLLPIMPVFLATNGSVLWNKVAVSNDKLRLFMNEANALNPVPQIVLQVSPTASCRRVHEIRSIMDAAPMCKGPQSRCSGGRKPEEWPVFGGP